MLSPKPYTPGPPSAAAPRVEMTVCLLFFSGSEARTQGFELGTGMKTVNTLLERRWALLGLEG